MEFRTQIPLQKHKENLIDYASKVLLLGSCFSENIGSKFEYYKFQSTVNPFGILFHPKAIEVLLERVVSQRFYTADDLVYQNEQYHCFDAHSSLSNSNEEVLLKELNAILKSMHQQISETSHLIITLGTSWVYEHISTEKTVANCHKIPQREFNKRILSVQEITSCLQNIEQLVNQLNPTVQLIYTVSPVRHIKDGFVENQQSKSHLIASIHQVLNAQRVCYFPSYEIMMDELRDYRFYTADMVHPNELAIDYIWEQFQTVWFNSSVKVTMKKVAIIQSGLTHRAFNPSSEQHQQFLKQLDAKKENLLAEFPFIKF